MTNINTIFISCFVGFLSAIGILLILLPKEEISAQENKKLAYFPKFSTHSLASGAYMDSIDAYVTDHFPMRHSFLKMADFFTGLGTSEEKIYQNAKSTDPIEIEQENTITAKDSIFGNQEQANNSKGLLVSGGQGIQIFTNEKPRTELLAKTLLRYKKEMDTDTRFFCVITPTSGAYFMPTKYQEFLGKEQENLLDLQQKLESQIAFVPVFEVLKAHQNEYIFFRTDHHWTGLGAYYAYRAFCQTAGLNPINLSEMTKKYVEGKFLGTHYLKTRDKSLENNADTVFYWEIKGEHQATQTKDGVTSPASVVQLEDIGNNLYLVFLGGDLPFMHLRSGLVQNGKKVLVVKNSYGNSFISYLLANYEQIWVVDYRHFKGNITQIAKQNKIDDFIFISGVFAANEPNHIKKIEKIK